MKKILLILGLVMGLTFSAAAQNTTEGDLDSQYAADLLAPGTKAPDFAIPNPSGKTVKLSDYKGKYVVLDFWASWCPDCRKELPDVEAAYERFKDAGVVFIGVSFDDSAEKWKNAVSSFGLRYVQVSELKKWKETTISPKYNIKWIPSLYVIDPKGNVVLGTVMTEKMISKLAEITGK